MSTRLAALGHQVTVYCRRRPAERFYRGVSLTYLPTIRHKYFDTVAHTLVSTLHLLGHRQDAVLYCNAANAVFTWLPRLFGMPVALNVDGLERHRRKWNRIAKTWYLVSEWLATFCPTAVVSDATEIAQYYLDRYGKHSEFIPYGADAGKLDTTAALDELNLSPRCYFLYVSRMEPENNGLLVREAFEQTAIPMKLALIGDAPYAPDYINRVRATSDVRVVIPGAIYGRGYQELQSHCFAYIHATEVGGTHPALIEAMGRGALTLYLDTPENAEVAAGAAIPFHKDDLRRKLEMLIDMPEPERDEWRRKAEERVRQRYSWESVTASYENLLDRLASRTYR